MSLKVRDLGEQGLLQRLQRFCPSYIVGDDAAVIPTDPNQALVITTDVLVDGVHFSVGFAAPDICTTSPEDAGWRAAAANLSDLAAMGASPLGITVGLGVPGDVPVAWLEQLYQGITTCLQQYAAVIVGGDICRSPVITLAITAFGQVVSAQAIQRSSARPGDAIVVTGVHGAAKGGLELLLHPQLGQSLSQLDRLTLIQAHQRPQPRLDVLPVLREVLQVGPQPSTFPVAGMDSSDGLADAIIQICRASSVGARVEREQITMPSELQRFVSSEQALDWALYGGEDFELVLCLPQSAAQQLVDRLGRGAAIVGNITSEPEVLLVHTQGNRPSQALTLDKGFQHF